MEYKVYSVLANHMNRVSGIKSGNIVSDILISLFNFLGFHLLLFSLASPSSETHKHGLFVKRTQKAYFR